MNQKQKKFSLTNLSYVKEIKSKLQKLDSIRNTTNTMIVQSDFSPIINTKLKTTIPRKSLQPLLNQSIHHNLSSNKRILNMKSQELKTQFNSTFSNSHIPTISNLASSKLLNNSINDEHSTISISTMNPSVDSEQIVIKDKSHYDPQEDSQINEYPHRKYRTTRSITSSSSTSKNSHDEPPLAPDTLIIGKLYILNEIYPSIENENMNGTPLAFLSSEKLLRNRIDWTKTQYPLSSYYIEIIIDLILIRPSFIREIPKVTKFNLYRPLTKIVSGHLFFDHGENKASIHRCERKQINRKFTIQDLASIHQREFYIINYNVTHEERFINLYENLFQIYHYETKSTHWKTYLIKSNYPINTLDVTSGISSNNAEIHHIKTLLTLNQTFSPVISTTEGSIQRRSIQYKRSISNQ